MELTPRNKATKHQKWNSICCLLTGGPSNSFGCSFFCIFAQNVLIHTKSPNGVCCCSHSYDMYACNAHQPMILKNISDFRNDCLEWKWSQCYVHVDSKYDWFLQQKCWNKFKVCRFWWKFWVNELFGANSIDYWCWLVNVIFDGFYHSTTPDTKIMHTDANLFGKFITAVSTF